MQVDGYNGIQGSGPLPPRPEGPKQATPASEAEQRERSAAAGQDSPDTLEISAQARELLSAQQAQPAAPEEEVRPDAVERARQILQNGLYNQAGVLEQTAERLGDLFRTQA